MRHCSNIPINLLVPINTSKMLTKLYVRNFILFIDKWIQFNLAYRDMKGNNNSTEIVFVHYYQMFDAACDKQSGYRMCYCRCILYVFLQNDITCQDAAPVFILCLFFYSFRKIHNKTMGLTGSCDCCIYVDIIV